MTPHYCPACQWWLHPVMSDRTARHNIDCASHGERQYRKARYTKIRTATVPRTHHGSDAHGEKSEVQEQQ